MRDWYSQQDDSALPRGEAMRNHRGGRSGGSSTRRPIDVRGTKHDRLRLLGLRHFTDTWGRRLTEWMHDEVALLFDETQHVGAARTLRFQNGGAAREITGHFSFEEVQWPLFSHPLVGEEEDEVLLWAEVRDERRPLVCRTGEGITFSIDLFREVGRCLTGEVPTLTAENAAELDVTPPAVDGYERLLVAFLLSEEPQAKPIPHPIDWPDGKSFAVILTHDVDRIAKSFQYVTHAWRSLRRFDIAGVSAQARSFRRKIRGEEPYWTFDQIVSHESRRAVRSTFFFLDERSPLLEEPREWKMRLGRYDPRSPKVTQQIRDLIAGGWEVGLHGSIRSAENPALLAREKQRLERLAARPIVGVRQHYMRLRGDTTWLAQEEAGLLYDTSVGSSRAPGFARGTCIPYHPWLEDAKTPLSLWEVPTALMDAAVLYRDLGSMKPRRNPTEIVKRCIDLVRLCGGVLNVLWHPHFFSREDFSSGADVYDWLMDVCQAENGWFATGSELVDWWQIHT